MHRILTLGQVLFRSRSWTPVPLAVWMAANGRPRGRWVVPGMALTSVGLALRFWAVAHIGPKSRTRSEEGPDHRAAGGPYRVLTHPLYVANALVSEGLVVVSGAGWPWLQIALPWLWLLEYGPIMLCEEAKLRQRFREARRRVVERTAKGEPSGWRTAWESERRTRQGVLVFLGVLVLVAVLSRAARRRPNP